MIKDEFSEKIGRLTKSSAYLNYCEEVYGYRAYLFNMLDKQQIDFILGSIPITSDDTILDLGCGSGSVLSMLVTKYGCRGIGLDMLDEKIIGLNNKNIKYIKGDMDRFSDFGLKPSITLSIDSLYFINDPDKLVRQLNSIEGNRMYLFYSQYKFDEVREDKGILQSNNTKIAGFLNKNGIQFKTVDYSENERRLYERSINTLQKYKEAFDGEGNIDLYEQKLKEDTFGMELYKKGLASRCLYVID